MDDGADTTMGEYYAVYQSGAELLGVGVSIADALRDAERWSDRALSSLTSYGLDGPRGETRGAYSLRPCTELPTPGRVTAAEGSPAGAASRGP